MNRPTASSTGPIPPPEASPLAAAEAIASENSPLVLLELIQRLKIRDVMTRSVLTAPRQAPMRQAQELMRIHGITGIPIAENARLYGLVSIGDIIRAIEGGYIEAPCGSHMTTRLVVLEDDMPVSFALQYFGKYHYGRFPVLSRNQLLVGIVSQRDINRALLLELSREVDRMELQRGRSRPVSDDRAPRYLLREFSVARLDFENAGKAANQIKLMLREKQIDPRLIRRIAVAAYELEMNLCVHSEGGTLSFLATQGRIEIQARDSGPGIADVEWACRDGTSTANDWIRSLGFGAGMGLSNVKRVADTFEISSRAGAGTTVRAVIELAQPAPPPTVAATGAADETP